jgi:hypothetical protein
MSEIKPDDPRGGPRHVESRVLSDAPVLQEDTAPDLKRLPEPQPELPPPADEIGPPTGDELVAAKYYAIAFLVVVIPLGLLILGMVVLAFVRSLDFLK